MSTSYQGLIKAINPKETKLNILLLAIPICCYFAYISHQETNAFFASLVAIMPLAFLMGHATEEIALRTSDSIGGLLNATFGNAAEIIICLLALWSAYKAGADSESAAIMIKIVQASLIGSILGNLLLVMGLAFIWGGIHHKVQSFNEMQFGSNNSLLLLAVITLVIPTVYHSTVSGVEGDTGVEDLSRAAAVILLGLYMLFLLFQLKTHSDLFATDGTHEHEEPKMTMNEAIALLVISTILVSWMAEILVHSLESAAEDVSMSHLFIGVILLPMFGNAAEHFTAVSVAAKNKMDLSFAIAIGSSTQIAVFVAPLMVLVAWMLGLSLTFEFGLLETVAAFLAVMIVNTIASDGKSNWLEGAMLLGTYAVLATAFWFHP
ncbi:MAG: calcium/proton exchanger [Euryarchaeota archaeon]|jgi:Ca2+:H+ antiporter|nr:calcium/proton exchanger [Euryarchaeota archaeon]MBT5614471.1 calcium/proton exchanger [Euryarchaeota archaeon]MBT6684360.1 calcium/proton exchanger [Euryarchaeota archaeon]MBT7412831.1 calcium/proton exchanger [Euryarchaeota archaeon]